MATVTVTVEKIGLEDLTLGDSTTTFARTTSVGGSQNVSKISVEGIETGRSGVTDEDMTKLHAITASAAQINAECNVTPKPLKGDATAGRIVRSALVQFAGKSGVTTDVIIADNWNGDAITTTVTDVSEYYTYAVSGNAIAILALSIVKAIVVAGYETFTIYPEIVSNDIRLTLQKDGANITFTNLLANDSNNLIAFILTYVTSA